MEFRKIGLRDVNSFDVAQRKVQQRSFQNKKKTLGFHKVGNFLTWCSKKTCNM
jgi:hypothetical protein